MRLGLLSGIEQIIQPLSRVQPNFRLFEKLPCWKFITGPGDIITLDCTQPSVVQQDLSLSLSLTHTDCSLSPCDSLTLNAFRLL
jgi:hypothetical protein